MDLIGRGYGRVVKIPDTTLPDSVRAWANGQIMYVKDSVEQFTARPNIPIPARKDGIDNLQEYLVPGSETSEAHDVFLLSREQCIDEIRKIDISTTEDSNRDDTFWKELSELQDLFEKLREK